MANQSINQTCWRELFPSLVRGPESLCRLVTVCPDERAAGLVG